MTKLYNRGKDRLKRRILRSNATKAEKILWEQIRRKQINGIKFRRQYSIKGFILDFYSPELRLAIEIDGGYHKKQTQKDYDIARQQLIQSLEITFLRFSNEDILHDIGRVLFEIKNHFPPYQGGNVSAKGGDKGGKIPPSYYRTVKSSWYLGIGQRASATTASA